jgi:hypothetical protein
MGELEMVGLADRCRVLTWCGRMWAKKGVRRVRVPTRKHLSVCPSVDDERAALFSFLIQSLRFSLSLRWSAGWVVWRILARRKQAGVNGSGLW